MKLIDGDTASFLMKLSALIGLEDSFTPPFSHTAYAARLSGMYLYQTLLGITVEATC